MILKYFRIVSFLILVCGAGISGAQIDTDGTLGPAKVLEGPDFSIGADLGQQNGGNLFHSFGQFNIHQGESATFTGPATVENIVSRVTGGNLSQIDGVLRSEIPNADMYLLNPAGIMFGENAKLEVDGSFHATTADILRLGGDGEFNAKLPEQSRLSVASPTAFGFLGENPGGITLENSFLEVPEGKSLSLIGGDINMHDSTLYVQGGRINLGSVASAGEVQLDEMGIETNGVTKFGEIAITRDSDFKLFNENTSYSDVEVSAMGPEKDSGRVFIRGGRFELQGGSVASYTQGLENDGEIDIWVSDDITLDQAGVVNGGRISTATSSIGDAGNVNIDANSLALNEGGAIVSLTIGKGASGEININADESVRISGKGEGNFSGVYTSTLEGEGKGRDIVLSVPNLAIDEGGTVTSLTTGSGNAGNVTIDTNQVSIKRGGNINSVTAGAATGGDITIIANDCLTIDEGTIQAVTQQDGTAGNVNIITGKSLTLGDKATIITNTYGTGKGGDITISANESVNIISGESLDNPSGIFANAKKIGDGGNIFLSTSDLEIKGSSMIEASTELDGNAGEIKLEMNNLTLNDGAKINCSTGGSGNGGNINLIAKESINVSGVYNDGRFSSIDSGSYGTGKSGDINIEAHEINITGASKIMATVSGSGNAGSIVIKISDSLKILGDSSGPCGIYSDSYSSEENAGKPGDIVIEGSKISIAGGAKISSKTWGSVNGGNITIKLSDNLVIEGSNAFVRSGIYANSYSSYINENNSGSTGTIDIQANTIKITDGARISNSTWGSVNGGKILIKTDALTISGTDPIFKLENSWSGGNWTNLNLWLHAQNPNPYAGNWTNEEIIIEHGSGSGVYSASYSEESGGGKGGEIEIEARKIEMEDGSQINCVATGTGKGGSIVIKADMLTLSNSGTGIVANSDSTEAEAANAGDMEIEACQIVVQDSAEISSNTKGSGNGGLIEIHADSITLKEKAKISSNTSGSGNGGHILFKVNDSLTISTLGSIVSDSYSKEADAGESGDIDIEAANIRFTDGAGISNNTWGAVNGGNIIIKVDMLTLSAFGTGIYSSSIGTEPGEYKAGNIEIEARQITITDGALITCMTLGTGDGGSVIIKVADTLTISGKYEYEYKPGMICYMTINSDSFGMEPEAGDAGNIEIEADQLMITDGASIDSSTFGDGKGGSVIINVSDMLTVSGQGSGIFANSHSLEPEGGDAKNIEIKAHQMMIRDAAQINSFSRGGGEGGTIIIKVADTLSVSGSDKKGFSAITADSLCQEDYGGKAGNIEIEAHQIEIKNGAQIKSTTSGGGKGGSLIIVADALIASGWPEDEIKNDSGIYSISEKEGGNGGDAGDIEIKAGQLILKDGAKIASDTHNSGKGGSIIIVAGTLAASGNRKDGTDGSAILANSLSKEDNGGDTGYIKIEARQITLLDGALISSSTLGIGNGDSIIIKVNEALIASGGPKVGNANSGIHARSNSEKENAGRAGKIELQANTVKLTDGGTIATSANNAAGGEITVNTPNSLYLRRGVITSSVQGGDGTGGDISIYCPVFVILDKSAIVANAHEGTGGNICITADHLIKDPDSTVTASSELGIDGTVNIDAPDTDISAGITVLPEKISDTSALLYNRCAARTKETTSSLLNTGLGQASMAPDDFLPGTLHPAPENDKETKPANKKSNTRNNSDRKAPFRPRNCK